MAVRLVWSSAATADLIDIYIMIGSENIRAADRYYDQLEARARQLADQPRMVSGDRISGPPHECWWRRRLYCSTKPFRTRTMAQSTGLKSSVWWTGVGI
ncbi:type II toxin-antitoxin system RelE/ParE family toxin [Mesorhizobium sp. B2-1-8]|uniref:type II toxin-antitoxin system RelE/ParE family toxin n=1 Tax=Mesorhizobium sp. B2-1-8 TaxID=2589967 RepID=UPI0011296E73|nr:type II toxin-antitoxin system RelE/ParE family toxin [Mesorhizobium sp. B2-1-8]